MIKGEKVLLRPMKQEDIARQHEFNQFVEEGRPRKVVWIDGEYTDLVNMSILYDEWSPT